MSYVLHFSSVQPLNCVWLFATPWTAARQASLSITNSQSLLKLLSIELVMPSNHLILFVPLYLYSMFWKKKYFPNIWDYLQMDKEGWYGSGRSSIKQKQVCNNMMQNTAPDVLALATPTSPLAPWVRKSRHMTGVPCCMHTLLSLLLLLLLSH